MSTILVDHTPEIVLSTSVNNAVLNITSTNVVVNKDTSNIVSYVQETYTPVSIGIQGPQGIPGASDNFVYLVAAETLGGGRIVSATNLGLVYASSTSTNILGITVGSVSQGQIAQVQISGIFTEPSWSWSLNSPVFVSNNGLPTQSVPLTGTVFILGFPVLSTQIFIDKQSPILLG